MKHKKPKREGRPKWLPTKAQIEQAEQLASRGLTNEEISDYFNVARSTLQARKKEYTDFSDAIRRGRAKGTSVVSKHLLKLCTQGNMDAIKFYLIYMAGRKEVKRVENTDGDGAPVPVKFTINIPKNNE